MSRTAERRRRNDRNRAVAIVLAITAHGLALALLAWTTPALKLPSVDFPPDVTLDLRPVKPLRESAAASPSRPRAARPTRALGSAPAPTPSRPNPRPAPQQQPAPAPPAPPSPSPRTATTRGGDTGAPGPAAAAGVSATPQDRSGGDPRGAVRAAIGCSHEDFLRLTAAERDACQRRLADQPRGAGPRLDLIDPLKRKGYDQQAAADERRRGHEGPMSSPVVACEHGSNFGTGCLPPEAMHSTRVGRTPRPPAPDVAKPESPDP